MGVLRRAGCLAGLLLAGAAMAGDIHLDKPQAGEPPSWQGRTLGEVADASQVERVLLLRAVTSAPRALDLANLRRMLADYADAPLRPMDAPPVPWRVREGIWHAMLLMRDGQVLELTVESGRRGLCGCLRNDAGSHGCFDLSRSGPDPAGPG